MDVRAELEALYQETRVLLAGDLTLEHRVTLLVAATEQLGHVANFDAATELHAVVELEEEQDALDAEIDRLAALAPVGRA